MHMYENELFSSSLTPVFLVFKLNSKIICILWDMMSALLVYTLFLLWYNLNILLFVLLEARKLVWKSISHEAGCELLKVIFGFSPNVFVLLDRNPNRWINLNNRRWDSCDFSAAGRRDSIEVNAAITLKTMMNGLRHFLLILFKVLCYRSKSISLHLRHSAY